MKYKIANAILLASSFLMFISLLSFCIWGFIHRPLTTAGLIIGVSFFGAFIWAIMVAFEVEGLDDGPGPK